MDRCDAGQFRTALGVASDFKIDETQHSIGGAASIAASFLVPGGAIVKVGVGLLKFSRPLNASTNIEGAIARAATGAAAAKTAASGADDVLGGVRLRAQLTGEKIAGGHAFQKPRWIRRSSRESRRDRSSRAT